MTLAKVTFPFSAAAIAGAVAISISAQSAVAQDRGAPFVRAIDELARIGPMIPGVIMAANSPTYGLDWQSAVGSVTLKGAQPLKDGDAFRIASITKVYTAATAFRAMEEGKFRYNDPIRGLLSPETAAVLTRGGYDLDKITVGNLLTHTSGLYDFAADKNWGATVRANPQRSWTRLEQIIYAVDNGKKLFEPGTQYSYSDTAYSLLCEIIERSVGVPLPAAAARLIDYRKLGLTRTHFEKLEKPPLGERRAHQYVGTFDVTNTDPSSDLYGAGGIVTTASELNRFMRALLLGRVFKKPETLPTGLLIPTVANPEGTDHAALVARIRLGHHMCWGHSGYWMVLSVYCPDLDLALSVTTNQNQFGPAAPDVKRSYDALLVVVGKAVDEFGAAAVGK
jgi:D-alanyl-D-alanine carboxypeptidase